VENVATAVDSYSYIQPLGVCAGITPFNIPAMIPLWMFPLAIACGNTVICKPSELTPMTAFLLTQILAEVQLPPGVVNVIFGLGAEAGEAIVTHSQIPLISFTGGTTTGKRLSQSAAPMIKKLSLELGGKNANIVFADADLDEAVNTSLRSSFLNQGEICLCGSRIYVEASVYDKFLQQFVAKTKSLKVGDPSKAENFLGALVSRDHWNKVKAYVQLAQEEGGTVETGLEPIVLSAPFENGFFMRPTVISDLPNQCRVMQEEIFGPVVTITPFQTEEEVVAMANSVEFGLAATLWTKDLSRTHRMARALEVGILWVNTWMMRDLRTPFGGMKMSGVGREGGLHSLEFFSECTNVCIKY
jgi:aminomuconate-semialdehyde/2-hydroxymuconate-6-semialdehyde dehydrogenase